MRKFGRLLLIGAGLTGNLTLTAFAQGTAFTYQGRLNSGPNPANGHYDLQFGIYDAVNNGTQQGSFVTNSATAVSNGLFTVTLDFGNEFPAGVSRWLDISVRTNGAATFVTLMPRQQLTSIPYSIQSLNAVSAASAQSVLAANISGALSPGQLPSGIVTNGASGVNISGSFSGDGSGLSNVPGTSPWQTVSGPNVTTAPNQSYLLTNGSATTVNLPANANAGDVVTVSGDGGSGWSALAATGQSIVGGQFVAPSIWTNVYPSSVNWSSVASSADCTKLVAVINGGGIFTSTNSGANWSTNNNAPPSSWASVASSTDGTKLVAVVNGGRIFTSTNSGANWSTNNDAPPSSWASVASSADGTKLVAVVNGGRIFTSTNSGANWSTNNNSIPSAWACVASSADGTKLVALINNSGFSFTSTNSGVYWSLLNNLNPNPWTCMASSADGTEIVAAYSGVSGSGVIRSTSSGLAWGLIYSSPPLANGSVASVASSWDGTRIVAAGPGYIVNSINSGATWSPMLGPVISTSVASSSDGSKLVLVTSPGAGSGIYTSTGSDAFTGSAGTSQFQYLGNGIWQPVGIPASQITGTLPAAVLTGVAMLNGGNNFTGNQTVANGNVGIGTTSPQQLLQVGDSTVAGSQGMIHFGSHTSDSISGAARDWDIGVPQTGSNVTGFGYSFVIRDLNASANADVVVQFATGNVGIGTNSPTSKLHVIGNILGTGTISSPMSRVTNIINTIGPLNLTNAFTSGGGTLIIFASGSGYTPSPGPKIGMNVVLDGLTIDTCTVGANAPANTHLAFVPKTVVKTGVPAGSHTLVLSPISGTATDVNDNFNVTVQEVPY
jgi:hypothetical protein